MNLAAKAALALTAAGLATLGATGSAFAHGGANADGKAEHSPGVVSGNLVQAPVHVPVNVVGNTGTVIGGLNPTFANDGFNG
ncbi:hypothetical protein GCM10010211_36640 [Streptomyces albospinus]|uniref:Chaplin domain-containing protein n=1 Tax=Streptomyces albospinus TaxID=285515 RepID=A0ABQ2V6X8_9ACTN|nr:chaplin [Streptomyces albospinus]GGU67867.1 hypothetical protein GCM10010211_36640 [Streptomyces albospinus]